MTTLGDHKERILSDMLRIIDEVDISDHNLDPHNDNYGRPTHNELKDSFDAICQIKMMFRNKRVRLEDL